LHRTATQTNNNKKNKTTKNNETVRAVLYQCSNTFVAAIVEAAFVVAMHTAKHRTLGVRVEPHKTVSTHLQSLT